MLWSFAEPLRSTPSCPFQARTEYLRKKAQGTLQSADGGHEDDVGQGESGAVEHLNLFPLEESALKKGNEEYLQEKKDEKVLLPLFMSLVCLSGGEASQTLRYAGASCFY